MLLLGWSADNARADALPIPSMGIPSQAPEEAVDETEPEPYRDTYLLDDDMLDEIDYLEQSESPIGRRYFAAEFILYRNDTNLFGSEDEQGVRVRWRRETIRYGELDVEVTLSGLQRSAAIDPANSTAALLTFRQVNAPVTDNWRMSNTIGYQRTRTGGEVGGYRIRLPSSPLMGISSEWNTLDNQIQFFTGRSGRADGIALNQFDSDGGVLSGASIRHEFSPAWSAIGEIVAFSGNDTTPRHTSLLSAARYISDNQRNSYDVSLLLNDDSDFGIWADAEHAFKNDILVRYGAYSLGTDLAWMDKLIVSDEIGAYFRTDTRSYIYSMSAGYDFAQTGGNAFGPMDTTTHNLYFSGNFRFTRNLNIGTSGTILARRFAELSNEQQVTWRLNNFAFYRSWLGSSRVELYLDQIDSVQAAGKRESRGARFSHQWRMPQSLRLTTQIGLEESKADGISDNLAEASVMIRHDLNDTFTWGVNASLYRGSGDQARSQDGVGINADLRWAFSPNWYVSAVLNRNATQFGTPPNLPVPGDTRENETTGDSFWLTVAYGKSNGRPIRILGNGGNNNSSGSVEGEIFYDENGDYVRQADERPVVGAIVLLDGRYEARTDALGRYVFDPVYTGAHWVSLDTSNLPLPWGLFDEAPQVVNVSMRRSGEANFALTRLN